MRFQCQKCNAILELDDCLPGELVQCDKCGAAVAVPDSPFSPGAIIGEFIIKRELGVGGMGTVYLAHQVTLDRDVALKVLKPQLSEDKQFIENFVNEARAVASINHPNIVQAYAVQCEGSVWYFAMEYVDGPTLHSLLEQGQPMTYPQTLSIAKEMVSGLRYAWETQQMIHRDIKPDNIMLNSSGHSKLADLGLACKGTKVTSQAEDLYGTPQYIAPELILGYASDVRSDIYSLGATLYHAITGRFPYVASTADELVMRHLQVPLQSVLELAPSCPVPFAALIENMLIKRPAQRYQDYAALEADLDLVTAGQMPSLKAPVEAQYPINVDAENPLALENAIVVEGIASSASATGTTRPKRTLKLSASSTSASPGKTSIKLSASASQALREQLDQTEKTPKKKKTGLLVGIAAAVVVMVGLVVGGVVMAMGGEEEAPAGEETVADGKLAVEEPQAEKAESPELPDKEQDAFSLKRLKIFVGQNSDQAFDEVMKLYMQDPARMSEVYALVSPLLENRLATARKLGISDSEHQWHDTVDQIKQERRQREEEARRKAAEERRQREEEERLAAEKAAKEKRMKAIADGKQEKMARLHVTMQERKFTSAMLSFQTMFEDEEEEQKEWRKGWLGYIETTERLWNALVAFQNTTPKGVKIPGYIYYKVHRDAMSEDENYTVLPFNLVSCKKGKVTFSIDKLTALQKYPSIQRRKYQRSLVGDIQFTVDYDLLLPEQQIAVAKAAMKMTEPDADSETVPDLVAANLLVTGNFLPVVFEEAVFENFRNADSFWETPKKEYAMTVNNELCERYVTYLTSLLKQAKANRRTLQGKVYETTLRRYVHALNKAFPQGGEDFQNVLQEIKTYVNNN